MDYNSSGYEPDENKSREELLQDLSNANRVLERVANSTHVMLACLDPQFNFLWVNRAYAEAGKREPADYIGKNHFDLYPHQENEAIFRRVVETGEPFEVNAKPFSHPDQPERGTTYWDWRLEPILDENGNVEMLLFSLTDVTETERTKRELKASLQERSLILDSTVEIIIHHDVEQNIQWANKSFTEATGKTLSELTGIKCYDAWGFGRFCEYCPVTRAIKSGQPQEGELSPDVVENWPRSQGFWLVRAAPVKDEAGNVTGAIEVAHDITKYREAEEELRRLNTYLEERVAERTELAEARAKQLSRLSYELTMAEHRERQRISEILHDHLQQVITAARMQTETLVEQIPESNKAEALKIVDLLSESIRSTRSLTRELAPPILKKEGLAPALEWLAGWMEQTHGLRVILRIDDSVKINGEGIRVLIFQSIRELLFNVIKHAVVSQAELEFRRTDGDFVQIILRDHGKGFNPDEVYNWHTHRSGFGLFSIHERISLIGGEFRIESTMGSGSCFTLLVPQKAREEAEIPY
ncbi:MAG: PAS domain-containing protein [Desulfobacterales bacterium]|nr:PAS domain-containing protein [Desulfobacterales bacterium]